MVRANFVIIYVFKVWVPHGCKVRLGRTSANPILMQGYKFRRGIQKHIARRTYECIKISPEMTTMRASGCPLSTHSRVAQIYLDAL